MVVLAALLWRKRHRAGAIALVVCALLLSLGGSPISLWLIQSLERPYTNTTVESLPVADAVVLLGGGAVGSPQDPLGFHLTASGDRILTALEVARRGKARTLVLGGSGVGLKPGEIREGEAVEKWMKAWSLSPVDIVTLGPSRNTRDEAVQLAVLMKERQWKRVIVVTSAFHMRRALGAMAAADIDAIPMPCDFNRSDTRPGWTFNPFPDARRMSLMDLYSHEIVGWWVYRSRGWVRTPQSSSQ